MKLQPADYTPDDSPDSPFLAKIADSTSFEELIFLRGVYADWLDDQGREDEAKIIKCRSPYLWHNRNNPRKPPARWQTPTRYIERTEDRVYIWHPERKPQVSYFLGFNALFPYTAKATYDFRGTRHTVEQKMIFYHSDQEAQMVFRELAAATFSAARKEQDRRTQLFGVIFYNYAPELIELKFSRRILV